jgi:hypothetical protein
MPFIAIDFEASCLPHYGRSFPIEVGIASAHGWSRSWLIRPHPTWSDWQWSAEAEALHGISRARLAREGLEAGQVARLLRAAVGQSELIADSHFDDGWSRALFAAAGATQPLPVTCLADLPAFHDVDADRLMIAMARADLQRLRRHRAEDDARWLASLLDGLGLDRPHAPPHAPAPVPVREAMPQLAVAR